MNKIHEADKNVGTFGITERTYIDKSDQLEIAREELLLNGFTILKSDLDKEQIQILKDETQRIYEIQIQESGGEENLKKIREQNIVRCPLAYSDFFKIAALNPILHSFLQKIWNEHYILISQNCVFNSKDSTTYHSNWHRDLIYQHWTSSRPLIMNAILCLDPFNLETGGTHILPFSQGFETFPSDSYVQKHQIVVNAEPGDYIFINAMIYHRIGKNYSDNPRMGLNHVVGLPFFGQHISIPSTLTEEPTDEFTKRFFGYRWNPAESVRSWRQEKIEELQ
jgi:hypothetical protein